MRTRYSIINSITGFLRSIISIVFVFVAQSLLIKILGVEYAGLNGLFTNILTLLNLFELGLGSAITYKLYKYIKEDNKETIKSILNFYKKSYNFIVLTIFCFGLILLPFIKYIVNDITVDLSIYIVYILFLLSTIATYFLAYKRSIIIAYQRNYVINIFDIIYTIILNVLQILIIYYTKNYYLYLLVKIICIIVENLLINIKINKDYPFLLQMDVNSLDPIIKNDIIKKVKALFIHKISTAITYGTDSIIISIFLGIKMVGLYSSYYYIVNTVHKLFSSLIAATSASVGNLLVDNNYNKNYIAYKKIVFLNYWIAVVTSMCLFFITQLFIRIWLGESYLLTKVVLLLLVINYFLSMIKVTFDLFKDAAGLWYEDRFVPLIKLLVNIISSIILVKFIGLSGVILGTLLSILVLYFYTYPILVYKILFNKKPKDYYKDIIKPLFVFIIVFIVNYLLFKLIVIGNVIIEIVVRLVLTIVVTNLLLIIAYFKNNNFKYYIKLLSSFIFKFILKHKVNS